MTITAANDAVTTSGSTTAVVPGVERARGHQHHAGAREDERDPRPAVDGLGEKHPAEQRRHHRRRRLHEEHVRDGRVVQGEEERARRRSRGTRPSRGPSGPSCETPAAFRRARSRGRGRRARRAANAARPATCVAGLASSPRCARPAVDQAIAATRIASWPSRARRRSRPEEPVTPSVNHGAVCGADAEARVSSRHARVHEAKRTRRLDRHPHRAEAPRATAERDRPRPAPDHRRKLVLGAGIVGGAAVALGALSRPPALDRRRRAAGLKPAKEG